VFFAHLLGAEAVKLLILCKERAIRKTAIQTAYAVKLIVGYHQVIPCVGDRFDMTRSNISCGTYQGKIK
jgi:hypothetical protein